MINKAIVHLGKFYPPHNGGIETHLRDLAVRQSRMTNVSVIVANNGFRSQDEIVEGVRVIRIARLATIASMPVCVGFTSAIRRCPADLVHIHMPNPGAAFSFMRSQWRGKLIITHHADTLGRKTLRKLSDPYVYKAMELASAIIVTSARYFESSEELEPFREKCHVIPLGIEPNQRNGNRDISQGEDLAAVSGEPIILAIGRLVPYKGFDILIRAMKQISATLFLIGSGPQNEQLKELIKSESVTQKVKMLGRVANLQPYFQTASIFVLPSITRAEAFGLVQLEAMAAGLPVINTNIESGVPEVSVDGITGLTVSPGNVDELAQAIQYLLNHNEVRKKFGNAASERVQCNYTADIMTERTLDLYRKVLN